MHLRALRIILLGCSWLASAAPQVVAEMDKQPPPVREQLAQHGIGSDKQSLIGALKNRDAEVRSLAAVRLGEPDLDAMRRESIPALAEALRTETEPMVASAMAAVLGGLGDFRGVRTLERMCHDPSVGPRAKLQVARLVLDLNSENCLDDILDLAFKGDDSDTVGVFYLLSQFQRFQHISSEDQDRIVQIIRKGLSDASPRTRLYAADVRGRMIDGSAAADLQRAIDAESDAHVRDSMRRALISLQKLTPQ
jgi:HEAT repeat protein